MATTHVDNSMTVSVVIPVRDRPVQLRRALLSVFQQDHPVSEVIVVDDGSSEPVTGIATEVLRLGLPVRVIPNRRSPGASGARNTGLYAATGEVVAFLDSDDVWLPHHVSSVLKAVNVELPPVAVVSEFITVPRGARRKSRSYLGGRHDLRLLLQGGAGDISASIIAVCGAGLRVRFDEGMAVLEDYDYLLQLATVGTITVTSETTTAKYVETVRLWNHERGLTGRQQLLDKWSSELSRTAMATTFQSWYLSYERGLVGRASGSKPPIGWVKVQCLRVRSRSAREISRLLTKSSLW